MKKRMNQRTGLPMICFIFLLSVMISWSVNAAEDFASSRTIQVNKTYSDSVSSGYAYNQGKNFYRFTVPSDGYIYLAFYNPLQSNSDTYWRAYLYNSDYQEMDNAEMRGNLTRTTMTKMGVGKGTYYLKIQSANYSSAASTDLYKIKVVFKASGSWEKEFNDNYLTATKRKINPEILRHDKERICV